MGLAKMFGGPLGSDVPAAVVAARCFIVAAIAIERTTQEELLQPVAILIAKIARIRREMEVVPTAVTVFVAELGEQGRIVIVYASGHYPLAVTERASDAKLSRDRLANERALIGDFAEKIGQLALDFEGHHLRFQRLGCHIAFSESGKRCRG
jgi:hypothetical protein